MAFVSRTTGAVLSWLAALSVCTAHMIPRDPAQLAGTVMTAEITEREIRMTYQISPADAAAYGWLVPAEGRAKLPPGTLPAPGAARAAPVVRMDRTTELRPRFVSAELRPRVRRDELTGRELPAGTGQAEQAVYADWVVEIPGKAEVVEFVPPAPSNNTGRIGMQVRHLGLAVNDFSWWQAPATFLLDWADPWYSKAADPKMRRAFADPLEIFVVADANEVRLEIAARPADWLDLPATGGTAITPKERSAMLRRMEERFREMLRLEADGKMILLGPGSLRFLTRALDGAHPPDENGMIPVAGALTGAIFASQASAPPRSLELRMSGFPSRIQRVPVTFRHSEGVTTATLAPAQNKVAWTASAPPATAEPPLPGGVLDVYRIAIPWAVFAMVPGLLWAALARSQSWLWRIAPLIALPVIVGFATGWSSWNHQVPLPVKTAAPMAEDKADMIVLHALNDCLTAFNEHDEGTRRKQLARAAMPAAAAELEKHLLGEFLPESLFGTRNRFRRLRWENPNYPNSPTPALIAFECDLQLLIGSAHWGHAHNRPARFKAYLEVRPSPNGWKLAELRLQRRQ